jgi:hypothetical protein
MPALALALALAGAGCATSTPDAAPPSPTEQVADLARVLAPWSREPFAVDPEIAAAADAKCRTDPSTQVRDPALDVVLVTSRGAGVVDVLYRLDTAYAECRIVLNAAGDMQSAGSGSGDGGPDGIAPREVRMMSGSRSGLNGADRGATSVTGFAGPGVATVRLVLPDGEAIPASLGGGLFTAWWPSSSEQYRIEGYDANGVLVGEDQP